MRFIVAQGNGKYRLKPVLHAGEVTLQSSSTSISGTVVDSTTMHAVSGGTTVVAVEQKDATGVDRVVMETVADSNRGFSFCPLPAGTYDVVITAVNGAGIAYGATVIMGVQPGNMLGNVPVIAAQLPASITGTVTTSTGSAATSADLSLSALQSITVNSTSVLVTIPLAAQSLATATVSTAPGAGCFVNTDCADYTLSVPASNPSVGAAASSSSTSREAIAATERGMPRGKLRRLPQRPDQDVEALGEVQPRFRIGQNDAAGARHAVDADFGLRILQRPGRVMNLAPVYLRFVHGVEAVPLGQPVLQSSRLAELDRSDGAIAPVEVSGCVAPRGIIDNLISKGFRLHVREKVREMVESPGRAHRQPAAGIEAEEVDSRLTAVRDVGAYVEFGKAEDASNRRHSAGAYATHPEWRDAYPALSLKEIERELRGDQRPHRFGRDWPMREEKVVPALRHHPRAGRQRPWAVYKRW